MEFGICRTGGSYTYAFTEGRFAITILGTFILIAGMIVIGIGYPARRAMSIEPAEALHEE